ncbi:type II secretion system F family protein [Ancylothrix sp. C2]|uniref:type II secretion system F family protein n=1 Tax=Ancylothrix sp. D3o TaxID=2953691 RepID=UPI0021BA51F6|nr:type II secretion system F family protein [Ancylothrix sp. D3o]MCT7950293.1 type II secretion system F family protein [Ancylothrix sp. D3o]
MAVASVGPGAKKDKAGAKGFDLSAMLAKITVKDKAVFSRQLAVMFNAGLPIVKAIGVLYEQCENPKLKKALGAIKADIETGIPLNESMRKFDDCFDKLYCAMIQSGELGGVLDKVLNKLAIMLEKSAKLQNQIKSASSYPKAVGTIAILVFFGMTTFLLPTFAKIFTELGSTLPPLTVFMLACSEFFRTPWKLGSLIGTIFALRTAFNAYYKTPVGRVQIDGIMLKLPLIGDLLQKAAVARFCGTFGMLTGAGVPLLTCFEIVADTAGNQVIANAIMKAKGEVEQGGSLTSAFAREKVFPNMAISMMAIGEESGEIDKMLQKVADFYEDEVEQAVKGLSSMLEPIMMVGIAGLVGAILMSMYLPMFAVFEKLG